MGLWQANFSDLMSVGIEVTAGQREALQHGGEVLGIQSLTEPGGAWCQCGSHHPAFDTEEEPVMVAFTMQSWPAQDVCPSVFYRPAGTTLLSEVLDEHYDEHWSFWPSYTGQVKGGVDCMDFDYGAYDDRPRVLRLWAGIPIAEIGSDIASEILQACNTRVEATPWWWVDRMIGYMTDGEMLAAEDFEDEAADVEFIEAAKGLSACGLYDIEKADFTEDFSMNLDYRPMSEYLSAPALSVWEELVHRSRFGARAAARTIRRGERNLYQHRESEFDPWF